MSNNGNKDTSGRKNSRHVRQRHSVPRYRFSPGVTPRNHRTDSIDYAVVISGGMDIGLDDGVDVPLKAGDVLVQRGTIPAG